MHLLKECKDTLISTHGDLEEYFSVKPLLKPRSFGFGKAV